MADGALPTVGDQQSADINTEIKKPSVLDDLNAERAKLYEIQANLMKQIEERSKPDPSAFWAAMARGFGNPNTPSFAGGAAGFAGNLQASQEEERKRSIEAAQMRMQLAQAQLAAKRSDVVGQALFGDQAGAKGNIDSIAQSAGVSPSVARAMPPDLQRAVMLQWMQGDEKGAVDTMAKFALKNAELTNEVKNAQYFANLTANPAETLRTFAKAYTDKPTIENKLALENALINAGKSGADIANIIKTLPASLAQHIYPVLNRILGISTPQQERMDVGAKAFPMTGTKEQQIAEANKIPNPIDRNAAIKQIESEFGSVTNKPFSQGLSLDDVNKLIIEDEKARIAEQSEARKEREKPWLEKNKSLSLYADYNYVSSNENKYNELMQLVNDSKNKKIFGLLTHQGPVYALLKAGEEGIQSPWGSIKLPVYESIMALKLNPQEQEVARNIMQLMSDLNQNVMRAGKDIYGPQISQYDAQKMAEPGFKSTDPASFISYLAAKNKITNSYLGKMGDAKETYFENNPRASTSSFFRSKEYRDIIDEYNKILNKFIKDKSPYR